MKKNILLIIIITSLQSFTAFAQQVVTSFNYTGDVQTFTVPVTGKYKLEVWGSQGGNDPAFPTTVFGGRGGYSKGEVTLTAGTILYIYVGGEGSGCTSSRWNSTGGGGSSDIRLVGGNWNDNAGLYSRIIVAGGGGGRHGKNYEGIDYVGNDGGGQSAPSYNIIGVNVTGANDISGGDSDYGSSVVQGSFGFANPGAEDNSCSVGGWNGGGRGSDNWAHGGAGGGWYGGVQSWPTGSGGSGYILTSTSYKPVGYTPGVAYYMDNSQLIAGNATMPNPTGGNMLGRSGTGFVAITNLYSATISQSSNVVCDTDSTGELSVAVNGGTGPYTYTWVPNVSASSIASGLTVGTYELTVTDANSLTTTSSFKITSSDNVVPTVVTKNIIVELDAVTGSVTVNAPDLDNGSTDNCGIASYMLSTGTTGTVCATTGEGGDLNISAPAGSVFTGVTFASYGTPDGSCGSFTLGGCNASNSVSVVSSYLIGQNTVTIPATNTVFTDPCGGTPKRLYVEATYGPSYTSFKTFSCADIGNNNVTFKVTDAAGNIATGTAKITVQDVTAPVITCPADITVNNDPGVCTANVTIPKGGNTPPNILLVAADDQTWAAEVQSKLIATGAFNSVDLFDAASGTPSTTLLANYKGVLLWTDIGANNPTLLGDNLVSYIDNGGGVVSMVFDIASVSISGVFNTDAYRCLIPNSQIQGTTESLGTIYDATHPIMNGVVSFSGGTSSYRSDSNTLATGAIKIADWTDGSPLVIVKENVGLSNVRRVDLNFFPPSTNSRSDFWDAATDGDLLMKNALLWVAGGTSVAGGVAASDGCSGAITITNNITGTNDASGVYSVGTTNVVWTATDASGNSSSCTQTITVMDTQNPTIATLSAMNVDADSGVCTYSSSRLMAPVATDNCSVVSVVASPASLVSGENIVTWTVTDGSGLTATSTQTVTVVDAENPTIATLSAMNVNADAGVCTYASSQLTAPTATDNCSVVSVVASPVSLVSGENIVTWTVTDGAGLTATSTQTITVIDTQNPMIATLSALNVNADAGVCTYVSTQLTVPLATDNCSVVSIVVSPASLVSGANTVTWTVTDGSGLTATSTQTVTVVDNEAPVVLTKNITVQLNAAGTASIVVADVNNGSTDNCGISLVELDKMAFTCDNVGANTVTLKVTDNNGNVATQTAVITVEDKIAPIVITKNITVQLDNSSNILIAAADVNNGSTDNCGISLLELDKALFSCADVGENVVTLKVTDNSGNVATRTAIVTIVNSQPNLIRKHFDDVIFFDNSSKAFVAYSWYKNGVLVSGQTAQYFKDSGVLNGTYYAKATKIDGTIVTTCPLTFSASIVDEYLKIAPNPVKSNASYQILTNVDSAKLQNARITVFTVLGVLVNDKMVDGTTTDMIAPNTDGIYVVRMTLANGKYFTKNLLVKN